MKAEFLKVLTEYLGEKNKGRQSFTGSKLGDFVRHDIPGIFVKQASLNDQYLVTGSIGQGQWAEIPWICVFNKRITTSAQNGYYIVYLFKSDMTGVYLSLNMGWTQFEKKYNNNQLAKSHVSSTAAKCREILDSYMEDFSTTPISLIPTRDMGEGYERGHICGKYYPRTAIPEDPVLIDDLRNLIGVYRELEGFMKKGVITTLESWTGQVVIQQSDIDDVQYNRDIESAAAKTIPNTPQPLPTSTIQKGRKKWQVDPGIGKACIIASNYTCELDSTHITFISKTTGQRYVEVHHLIPMSKQELFKNSLDVPGNTIALCPNCHKKLHLGSKAESQRAVEILFNSRKEKLLQAGLSTSLDNVQRYY